ncbi:MAG TPA: hypothetical protein VL242_44405, partial [Sorangium sp.]|nr:hypothetical protein [Sorangium sp.]
MKFQERRESQAPARREPPGSAAARRSTLSLDVAAPPRRGAMGREDDAAEAPNAAFSRRAFVHRLRALMSFEPVAGFRFGAISAGIRKDGRIDVALAVADQPAVVAGTFTR